MTREVTMKMVMETVKRFFVERDPEQDWELAERYNESYKAERGTVDQSGDVRTALSTESRG
jgi:hypothetical protein